MSAFRLKDLPLRARFLLWQFAVLAPLLITALIGQLYLLPRLVEPLQEIAEELTDEVMLVKNLQINLLMAAMPVNDYLIHSETREFKLYVMHRDRVDQGFDAARAAPFSNEQEQQLVEAAWHQWQQAKRLASELFQLKDPTLAAIKGDKMEAFDHRVIQSAQLLEQIYNMAQHEIREAQTESEHARVRVIWITIAAFSMALAASLLIGYALVHSIISGLEALGEGAARITAGRSPAPIRPRGGHEIETLMQNFNIMAEQVKAHDAALQELAIHDELTGLENRRAFSTRLDEELQRAERYHHPLTLLMIDIDHFKAVNDTYGHKAGDRVLRQLAEVMETIIRPVDRAARYGGEEFVILVPETTAEGAEVEAERLRATIAATQFAILPGRTIQVSVSIGVAAFPGDANSMDDLLEAADNALYRAKRAGRNQVRRYRS